MTATDPPHRQPSPPQRAVLIYGFQGIRRAGGVVSAIPSQERRYEYLISADELQEPPREVIGAGGPRRAQTSSSTSGRSGRIACLTHPTISSKAASATSGDATTTYAVPSASSTRARASRKRRFARLRTTAPPTLRPATTPTRGGPPPPLAETTSTPPLRRREPVRYTRENSACRRSDAYGRPLRREAAASFATSALQDGPSGTRPHAGSEPVPALAAPHLWLISTLHEGRTGGRGRGMEQQVTDRARPLSKLRGATSSTDPR